MATEPTPSWNGDPLLARVERLAARRESAPSASPRGASRGSPAGSPLPPPVPTLSGPQFVDHVPTGARRDVDSRASRATTPTRRRHPARGARIGALAVSCATTGGLAYLFADMNATRAASQAIAGLPAPIATTPTADSSSSASSSVPTTSSAVGAGSTHSTNTAAPETTQAASATVAAFNGNVVNTRYGPVQVQVQISNGRLADVAVVQYPGEDGKSLRINGRALPQLRTEALTAQSSSVDTISGATYTSDGYARSLQSALDEARAAGATTLA
jgi:uncharacterized protein with FMN-binding domain